MKLLKDPRYFLILGFVALIGSVPAVQLVKEAREGNGIRAFELFSQRPTAENLRSYEQTLETANWLGQLSRPLVHFVQFQWLRDGGEKVAVGRGGWYFYKPGVKFKFARRENRKAPGTDTDPLAAIVDFRDQLALRGIKLLVMPVPDKESIYPDRLSSRAADVGGFVAPHTKELFTKLRAADVEVVDLFKVFHALRQEGDAATTDKLYLAQDTHWSPDGVKAAAQAVARQLIELGWVRPGTSEYEERAVGVRRLGDILQMLQLGGIERRIAPESVHCTQVIREETGEAYTDEAEAEILVLGDSFMRIYQQDAPNAGGFIAHLAKELKQPLLSLVSDGGGSTLVREELSGRPAFLKKKKVVIWEFVERDIGLGLKGWKHVSLGPPS